MKLLTALLAGVAVLSGCSANVKPVPTIATVPVVVKKTEVRYVPIDAALTAHLPELAAIVPGVTPWGIILKTAQACSAEVDAANGRFDEIGAIQGQPKP